MIKPNTATAKKNPMFFAGVTKFDKSNNIAKNGTKLRIILKKLLLCLCNIGKIKGRPTLKLNIKRSKDDFKKKK